MSRYKEVPFESLVGETLLEIHGAGVGSDEIILTTVSGRTFRMMHYQDCCECVQVEETIGDLTALLGKPLLMAREDVSSEGDAKYGDHTTWTFYHLATVKGTVTLRWMGSSNGYYSEAVCFEEEVAG